MKFVFGKISNLRKAALAVLFAFVLSFTCLGVYSFAGVEGEAEGKHAENCGRAKCT